MTRLSTVLLAGLGLIGLSTQAHADYMFKGSGSSGSLVSPSEGWIFNADGGAPETGYLNNWGSPGVGQSLTTYGEALPAYGMDLTFTGGGPIDLSSVSIGNSSACTGSTMGGTTFCTGSLDIWNAFVTGPDTIELRAQSAAYDLVQGEDYFVNVFFDGSTPTAFTGDWLTSFSPTPGPVPVPEPASLALFAVAVLGLGTMRYRRV